jgi:ABC-type Zn uptake system ZnuABC Zn-binding protein ZnuA
MKNTIYTIILLGSFLLAMNSQAALKVVTTTEDLAAIAREIGGSFIEVSSLTPGSRDPHFAEAKPSMVRAVYQADLLVVVGADMEIGWLPLLLQSARNEKVQPGSKGYLDVSLEIPLLEKLTGSVSRAMGDVHAKGNPHYLLDPENGIRIAQVITTRLSEIDPKNSAEYQLKMSIFKKNMTVKIAEWRTALMPLKDRSVIAYHRSFVYLANAFDFIIIDEVEPKPGIAPSASHLTDIVSKIKKDDIGLLIMEPYYEQRSTRYLHEQTGIRVAVIPQSVGAYPQITRYIDLFDHIVNILAKKEGND